MNMTDVNPIVPEFGELGGKTPIGPIKQIQEPDHSTAFKEELEKQARRVNEKEKGDQTQKEEDAKQELIQKKPLISEWVDTQPENMTSVFEVEKAKHAKKMPTSENPAQILSIKTPLVEVSLESGSSDLSSGDDSLAKSLPEAPIHLVEERKPLQKSTEKAPLVAAPTPIKEPVSQTPTETETKPITASKTAEPSFDQNPQNGSDQNKKQEPSLQTKQAPLSQPTPEAKPIIQEPLPTPVNKQENPAIKTPLILTASKEPEKISLEPRKEIEPPPSINLIPEKREIPTLQTPAPAEQPSFEQPVNTAQPLQPEAPQPSLIEKVDPSKAPLFAGPLPIENRKKDEASIIKEDKESSEGRSRIQAPSESNSLEQEKKENEEEKGRFFAEDEDKLTTPYPVSSNTSAPIFMEGPATPPQVISGFDNLHPEILNLFDRLLGIITVIQMQGKTETTFTLNEKQSEALKNTEVTLTTYDTAPLSYNIELSGPPEAVNLLQRNIDQLQKSFKDPKKEFNFQINEIRVSLQSEKKLEQEKNKKN